MNEVHLLNPGEITVYTDGASRGNPGPAAVAVKIVDEEGQVLRQISRFVGKKTNNEAEYAALIAGLTLASDLTTGRVQCFLDSELAVKQLNEEYQVRSFKLESLWLEVRRLQKRFRHVTFSHVSREDRNMVDVDRQANEVLDQMSQRGLKS
jgi:ribonuclease HI